MAGATAKRDGFVHLHTHTEYSMLDGAAKLDELFAEANRLGQDALAITDHGYLFGAFDFWNKAQQYGIKPIIGLEAYLAPGSDRKSTRLNSSHVAISYAVFCLTTTTLGILPK